MTTIGRSWLRGVAVFGLVAAPLVVPVAAVAAPLPVAATPATGAYSGSSTADLVHLNAVNIPGTVDVADAFVAPVSSTASTAASPRVKSDATNASLNLLGTGANNLLVEAHQTAPPDNAKGVSAELLKVPAAPLLTADVATAGAHSRWVGDDSCLLGSPLSTSISKVADAVVLPGSPLGADLLSLNNGSDPSGAVVSTTSVGLASGSPNASVVSSSSTQVTAVNLLNQLKISVITAPKVTATATGVAGTAKVDVVQPVLSINGTTYISGQTLSPINIPGGPVLVLTVGNVTKKVSADGTMAEGSGNLLTLKVLDVTGTFTLASLTVGDVNAKATAPAGGVVCGSTSGSGGPTSDNPLRDARKDASAASVNPGATFDYTITVPNRGTSDLTDVTVKDTVSGSPALDLVKADPAASSSSGSTYTFDLGTITPNQVKTITMTFKVPTDAADGTQYSNSADITATYAGKTVSKTVSTDFPVVDAAGAAGCDLSRSDKFASHLQVTTGESFTYYVNVFNQGGSDCSGVVVKDTLPSGVTFVSCTHDCTNSGQDVTWTVGTVKAGASEQLAVTVKTTATSGTLLNGADVTPSSGIAGHPTVNGPEVTDVSVLSPSKPATRGPSLGTALANTGANPLMALSGLGLIVVGYAARRRFSMG